MKLHYTPRSPYVRKVRATAVELGIADKIDLIAVDLHHPPEELAVDNPLAKVPTLVMDDGDSLFDSPVICEYLHHVAGDNRLFPAAGKARWTALRRMALADGILDATTGRRHELQRPEGERSASYIDKQKAKAERGLDALENEVDALGAEVTVGHIAIACVLGYLDFRFAGEPWRPTRPKLAKWHEAFAQRPCMVETAPPAE